MKSIAQNSGRRTTFNWALIWFPPINLWSVPSKMEHPFLSVKEIKDTMTIEQIQEKIRMLADRLRFAYNTGNGPLINQLHMVYEVYTNAQIEKLNELFSSDGKDHQNKIDIK